MTANQFGSRFSITTFGESHGAALGVVIDGCPAGVKFEKEILTADLEKRRPGPWSLNRVVSGRKESDTPEILSGIFEDRTLGTPIAVIVRNEDARSEDYQEIKNTPRTGHADDVWKNKFGHSDHRGGGRSSGRETLSRVIAGSIAKMLIKNISPSCEIIAYASRIGPIVLSGPQPSKEESQSVINALSEAQSKGESFDGEATLIIKNPPANMGQPVFHKFKSDLAMALLSVGATDSFQLGEHSHQQGTQFHQNKNNYGGIRGGITTGEDIFCRVGFKPTSSILDIAKKGRHDPCIVPRALPVLEAMAALVIADHLLLARSDQV